MGIRERDELAVVGRVRQDLLITAHGSVEDHLAQGSTGNADGQSLEDRPVFER